MTTRFQNHIKMIAIEYNIPGVPEIGEDIVVLLLDVGEEAGVVHDGVHEAHVTGEALLTAQRPNLD